MRGLMNIQFAVKDGEIYVLEVNPRASRTVPFVSKATGLNLAQAAARVMVGRTLEEQGITAEPVPTVRLGEGGGLPVRQVPGRGHRARARDAVDRRGDGDRHGLPVGLRQEPARGHQPAAGRAGRSSSAWRRATARRSCRSPAGWPPWASSLHRHRAAPPGALAEHGIDVDDRPQDPRGPAQPARLPGQRRDRPDRQHPQRQGRPHRRGPHPRQPPSATASPASPRSPAPAPPSPPWNGCGRAS